jgi:type III secretion system TyeA family effector delivery regulator
VDFLTGVRNCVKALPEQVFSAPEARQSLLDAAQGAIDDAIDFEETQG